MQTDARVGAVMEGGGGQRVFNTGHGAVVVDGGAAGAACKLMEQQRKEKERALHDHQPRIGTVSQLIAGGVAGAVGKTCTAPLARLTILFQLQGMHTDAANLKSASIWRETTRIIKEEGYRAFWRGNLVTIAHRIPYSSVSFYAFERYKNLLQLVLGVESPGENISKDLAVRLVGGGLAGITAASVTYPLDLVRTRLAAQTNVIYYRGIWHALRTISREEGATGLYKGLGATLLGVGPSLAISFAVYETARTHWQFHRPDDSTVLVGLGCGSLSGIASSTVTFPLDLVRRRMQLEGAGGRARVYKTGIFGTFKNIFKTEGLRGLYRGILPEYYKVVPGVSIVFMTYEKLKQFLSNIPDG
ncbi:OLC1v1026646C2 [Oldenlandia corymbosa var. corymbosa]|uniref:OLC1v1026646C2 n=1 Tax=Oldenlandia corymbosa var. corymbosa TaxID=529605 RepID=A0AAV1C7K5_OLDCO|nr:OLC1v1026646C2 [Oldenlandia corymbosa var. corymbosa]